jgi:hypothetical protein
MAIKPNTMSDPTVAGRPPKREKINIFKLGRLWCFKHFFDDKEIFRELYEYYNQDKYRFELPTVGERNKIMKYLDRKGFELALIEDPSEYAVTLEVFKKYASILKNSIDNDVKGNLRIFVMTDMAAVEEAITAGAKKYKGA